ncbi:hypothetical protein AB0B48_31425, partial [Micromonospora sp. NPDC049089]|uniref:hypothetical protein n=1 Tax=Micromonospora sp. NPDC049089 TaxID=3155496 RepID=UPI0034100453
DLMNYVLRVSHMIKKRAAPSPLRSARRHLLRAVRTGDVRELYAERPTIPPDAMIFDPSGTAGFRAESGVPCLVAGARFPGRR